MLETVRRQNNIVNVPKCAFGKAEDCYARMRAQVPEQALPVHNGELYLELHRGCQTTQARTKRNNRKCEHLLHDAEWIGAMAMLEGGSYAHKKLFDAWRILLTHQFHDILPGSSITEVYKDADANYAKIRDGVSGLLGASIGALAKRIDTRGPGAPILVFNPLSWLRTDVCTVKMPLPDGPFHVVSPSGSIVASQRIADDEALFETDAVPPMGWAVYRLVPGSATPAEEHTLDVSAKRMENAFLRVKFDESGRFTSVYDKFAEREAIAPGQKGNVLQLFDDRPAHNDAWDIEVNFDATMWEPGKAVALGVIEQGPVRAMVRVVRKTEHSTITQDITMYAVQPRIDVVTHVDWHEKRTLLKVAFPVDVLASRATYHIQFATVERATHDNTDYDRARFEVPAHHWADLSEGDYGVSLLNDCKYGYDVSGNTLRLSLLRSPIDPDPRADEGEHEFVYSLFPHDGDWRCETVQQGYELNQPLLAAPVKTHKGDLAHIHTFAELDADHVVLSAVKKAEDSDALIVRVYEAYGQRGPVQLSFGRAPKQVSECDLMEENDVPVKVEGSAVSFYVKPYEIRSFKVAF
jgi:alpha-mannosidase